MRRFLSAALLSLLAACLWGPGSARADEVWHESYTRAEDVQAIYGGSRDVVSLAEARRLLLTLTNEARRRGGEPELGWSEPATQLADQHAKEMAGLHYINHYDLAGHKCEYRFNALGETDNVMENIAYYEINLDVGLTPQLIRRIQQHWLDSPGHRANILEPAHTQMGCSFALDQHDGVTYVAAIAEFVADWGETEPLEAAAPRGAALTLRGHLNPERARLLYVGLGSEDLPFERSVDYQNSHAGGYSPPQPVLALLPRDAASLADDDSLPDTVKYQSRNVYYEPDTGEFSALINLPAHWPPAAYYVTVWADSPGHPELGRFCVSTQVVLVQ